MQRIESGELKIVKSLITERKNPPINALSTTEAPFNEDFIVADVATGEEVVRCHRFLQSDKITPVENRLPDPKEINWKGKNYHQKGKKNPECAHCLAGISTHPDVQE